MFGFVVCYSFLAPFTFQNVSLRLSTCTRGRGQVLSECQMFCFMLSASSLCGCSQVLLVSLVLSCLVLSLRSACLFARKGKGSGSYVHFCPRPCLSTCRWARLATHRHWGPLCVSPVLSCPLWPYNRRMCVIAKETGQFPLARTCSRTWVFQRRLHI